MHDNNIIFSTHYNNYEKKKENMLEKAPRKDNSFKQLMSQYSEKGYKIPNLSSKKKNLFNSSALLLENGQIENHFRYSRNKTGNDLLFLEKVANTVDDRVKKIYIGENKNPIQKRKSIVYKDEDNILQNLLYENYELLAYNNKIKMNQNNMFYINTDESEKERKGTLMPFKHTSHIQITPSNGRLSSVELKNNVTRKKKTVTSNNVNLLPSKLPSPLKKLLTNSSSELHSLNNRSRKKTIKERDQAVKNKQMKFKRDVFMEHIYDNRNDCDTMKVLLKDYYKTFYHKNEDQLNEMFNFKYEKLTQN
jgi:hypothetical protein